jgi:hypothetical protein
MEPADGRRVLSAHAKRVALAGFLAGYSGLPGQAYELDLRQYVVEEELLDYSPVPAAAGVRRRLAR